VPPCYAPVACGRTAERPVDSQVMDLLVRTVGPVATNCLILADPRSREAIAVDTAIPSLAWIADELAARDWTLKLIVSTHGGESPAWAPDGRHLFYRAASDLDYRLVDPRDRDHVPPLMSVRVIVGATISLGRPTELFRGVYWGDNGVRDYDIAPDGRRFLFARLKERPTPEPPITRLNLVHNWFAELERLSPTRRPHAAQETAR